MRIASRLDPPSPVASAPSRTPAPVPPRAVDSLAAMTSSAVEPRIEWPAPAPAAAPRFDLERVLEDLLERVALEGGGDLA